MDNIATSTHAGTRRKNIRNAGLIFLIIMIVLTFFSKTINSFLMPEVEFTKPTSGFLQTETSSKGKVKVLDIQKIYAYGNWMVKEVKVKEGTEVVKGDVLAIVGADDVMLDMKTRELELMKMENGLEQYRGSYDQIRSQNEINLLSKAVEKAMKELDSMNILYESGAETKKAVENAQEMLDSAIVNYENGIEDFDRKKKDYDRTLKEKEMELVLKKLEYKKLMDKLPKGGNVVSSFDGIVKTVAIEKGETCSNGQAIFELVNKDSPMYVEWFLTPEKADSIEEGDSVSFKASSDDSGTNENTIKEKQYSASNGMYIFKSDISTETENFKDSQEVTVTIRKQSKDYPLIIPKSSIIKGSGKDYVYILKQNSGVLGEVERVEIVYVKVLESDDFNSAINGTIDQEDDIVTFSSKALNDGVQVKLR